MLIPFDHLFRKYHIKTPGVLHLGANTGQEAEAYQKQGIARVIWVEAIPEVFAVLRRHLGAYPGQIPLLACVSDTDGQEVVFHVSSNQGQSSSILEFGTHLQEHPTVRYVSEFKTQTIRVDTLLAREQLKVGPDWFLNIDLQGAELLALRGMGDLLHQFKYAYIEVNERELYKGCPLTKDIDNYLRNYGFLPKETKMTGSGWGDRHYQRT